ncbi:hypothetical protein SAMN02745823_01358 [Sporobacter termitidis DSM 10068]|uniref:DUF2953 domain-containing protein n=1 Tax=Sporobacter termitidis DSM 10068 TaxID=1123282 RepID=A0A1M5WLP8_9FIRM|nr:hypothetical protein [Sporobacter termitidis]SHH88530.1 hypothetical protein SAMN02745823_01358 [Sporobacter termitidis DSM 10068]
MTVILLIALAIFLIALAIFLIPVKISSHLDVSMADVYTKATWSFIKAELKLIGDQAFLRIFLFNMKVFSRFINRKRKKHRRSAVQILKALKLNHTALDINYGFNEPYLTGIFFVILNFIASIFNKAEVGLYPEFLPDAEFLRIKAKTNLNIGKTIINLSRQKV